MVGETGGYRVAAVAKERSGMVILTSCTYISTVLYKYLMILQQREQRVASEQLTRLPGCFNTGGPAKLFISLTECRRVPPSCPNKSASEQCIC